MELLRELLNEAAKKKLKKASAAVYARDYERTKDKEYRQYDPLEYKIKKKHKTKKD